MTQECSEHVDRICLTLVQSEIEVASSFVRLAEAEAQGGSMPHAIELLTRAILAHKGVLKELGAMSSDCQEEKSALWSEARNLLESIQSVERRLQIL